VVLFCVHHSSGLASRPVSRPSLARPSLHHLACTTLPRGCLTRIVRHFGFQFARSTTTSLRIRDLLNFTDPTRIQSFAAVLANLHSLLCLISLNYCKPTLPCRFPAASQNNVTEVWLFPIHYTGASLMGTTPLSGILSHSSVLLATEFHDGHTFLLFDPPRTIPHHRRH
jgi:hypothetical protein